MLKKVVTYLFFGNRRVLGIKSIGKKSKIGLFYNILRGKYVSIGENSAIGRFSRLHCYDKFAGQELKPEVVIGNNCIFGQNLTIICADKIEIQDWVTVAGYCTIVNENHGINPENEVYYRNQPLITAPILIGEGTWIGERCCILPGVTIGKKCIIGSGSIVTKSIPDYCVAVGNPAKVIKKYNFSKHEWERCQ